MVEFELGWQMNKRGPKRRLRQEKYRVTPKALESGGMDSKGTHHSHLAAEQRQESP